MNSIHISLCCPDNEKSCFACCPPIRTSGYEHIQYSRIIKRILLENTQQFDNIENNLNPITGFSCWALGYLDKEFKQIGCLLHPAQNRGTDHRYRIDYGEKCRRETCPEEKLFSELELNDQKFWIHLGDGLDSFAYSSRKTNHLFKIIGWGKTLLNLISTKEKERIISRDSFLSEYCFFSTSLPSRGSAYLINQLIDEEKIDLLKRDIFRKDFEHFTQKVSEKLNSEYGLDDKGRYVHTLDIEPAFSDFLRISAGISKIRIKDAVKLKNQVDKDLEKFRGNLF